MLNAGDSMPNVSLVDDEGNRVDTHALLGKSLVLWFYPKDDTPG